MDFFFDAHFHATLKRHFANPAQQLPDGELPVFNPWKTTVIADFLKGFNAISLAKCLIKPFVENTLVSQCSLMQLTESNYKLGVVALFSPDKGLLQLIAQNSLFMKVVTKGKFGDLLVSSQFKSLETTVNAFETVKRDLVLLDLSGLPGGKKIRKLQDSRFDPDDSLAVVFSVEGLHCLRSNLNDTNPATIIADILANLTEIVESDNKVLFINIAHIDDSNTLFANQAYAVDGFREAGFNEKNLRPTGNGFTEAGKQIVQELYNREILPDVKHMSWLSRRQFYEFRNKEGIDAPIVSSHTGFTGCWFNRNGERISDYILPDAEARKFARKGQHRVLLAKPNPYTDDNEIGFNASTINLFNEDIEAILRSDGLIGISLDQRILGFSEFRDDREFTSKNVFNLREGVKILTDSDFISDAEYTAEPVFKDISQRMDKLLKCVRTEDRKTGNSTDVELFFHPRHFYLHIVHAITTAREIGGPEGEEFATKMLTKVLCIGSDFDGLIDGLDCCPNATRMPEFKKRFVSEFGDFMKETNTRLPLGLTVQKVADRIFYENGRDFVLKRLDALNAIG